MRVALVGVALALTPMSIMLASSSRPVAPGGAELPTRIETRCPTFSWTVGDPSSEVELAVFRYRGSGDARDSAELVWTVKLPAGSVSWTPDADRCLDPGLYGWSLRAAGGAVSNESLLFAVESGGVSLEEAARRVRLYLNGGGSLEALWERLDSKKKPQRSVEPPGTGVPVDLDSLADRQPSGGTEGLDDEIVASSFGYTTLKSYRHTVPGTAFRPSQNPERRGFVNDGLYQRLSLGDTGAFYAPLNLPDGARMRALTCYHYDSEPENSAIWTTELRRRALNVQEWSVLVEVVNDSSGSSGQIFEETVDFFASVNNEQSAYLLSTSYDHDFGTDSFLLFLRFYGCHIRYELSEPSSN